MTATTKRRRRPIFIDDSFCVFCNNENVNYLEENLKFCTLKTCGHQICLVCLNGNAFTKKNVTCPSCGEPVKRTQVSEKSKEELDYEREKDIRTKVKREFNLERGDFETSPEYREYEELAAAIIHNLYLKDQLDWCEKQMENNRKKYRALIARNASKHAEQERLLIEQLKQERRNDLEFLKRIEISEKRAKFEKQLNIQESNLVKLGELTETTEDKKQRLKVTEDKKKYAEKLKEYEGILKDKKNPNNNSNSSVFWRHAQLMQPKPVPSSQPHKEESGSKKAAAVAGGYDPTVVLIKTQKLMYIDI